MPFWWQNEPNRKEVLLMELGFFTMPLHPPGSDITKTMDDDLEQVIRLDELGYKEAWIGEHFTFAWENIPCPDLFIAKALPMTKNIVLGTGVTCMPIHNPAVVAHRIAQLDHLAHGRFYWGVGSSSTPGDCQMFGFDPKTSDRHKATREGIDAVLKIWMDPKPGLYETENWRFRIPEPKDDIGLRVHLKPYQKPHPPIAVAGSSAKSDTLVLAGERGWIPMSINLVPVAVIKTHWEAVEEGAEKTGRIPDRSKWRIAREVYVADTTEQARKEAAEGTLMRDFKGYWFKLFGQGQFRQDPNMSEADVTAEYLIDKLWIVGSPDDVANQLRQLYEEVGGFGMLLAMGHEWEPKEQWLNSMTLLQNEVMPKLADLRPKRIA
jgi:alkanesulfonate monooxygenase SsuD/methylene tetrahydromethanopterin reductase-like flavin-dependent oxidoreductase (luciferase family)